MLESEDAYDCSVNEIGLNLPSQKLSIVQSIVGTVLISIYSGGLIITAIAAFIVEMKNKNENKNKSKSKSKSKVTKTQREFELEINKKDEQYKQENKNGNKLVSCININTTQNLQSGMDWQSNLFAIVLDLFNWISFVLQFSYDPHEK